jgi:hypothetical protein
MAGPHGSVLVTMLAGRHAAVAVACPTPQVALGPRRGGEQGCPGTTAGRVALWTLGSALSLALDFSPALSSPLFLVLHLCSLAGPTGSTWGSRQRPLASYQALRGPGPHVSPAAHATVQTEQGTAWGQSRTQPQDTAGHTAWEQSRTHSLGTQQDTASGQSRTQPGDRAGHTVWGQSRTHSLGTEHDTAWRQSRTHSLGAEQDTQPQERWSRTPSLGWWTSMNTQSCAPPFPRKGNSGP